ncbi:hypothetical protein CVT26_009517 [Gymnopilus dilepis]|uniref:Ubiquitin 3 binding protein But2 C-terminal domain-containing protein n=1 Tax=Gymnopilus dilepis TaxID=231916 RepID=A0A409VJU8_9AGAR|nr:hypothetical protein CVT26_009517 [Gymnopilus dilepis]
MSEKPVKGPLIPLDNREFLSRNKKEIPDTSHGEFGLQDPQPSPSTWFLMILIIGVLINCIPALLHLSTPLFDPIFSATRQQFYVLQHSSSRPVRTRPELVLSYAPVVAQFNTSVGQDFLPHGLAPLDDQKQDTFPSTLFVQFDAIDFDKGQCELNLHFEPKETSMDDEEKGSFSLAIYQVSEIPTTAMEAIPTAPKRLDKLGTALVVPGVTVDWHERLACSQGDILTFEIACFDSAGTVSSRCPIGGWKNEGDRNRGIPLSHIYATSSSRLALAISC